MGREGRDRGLKKGGTLGDTGGQTRGLWEVDRGPEGKKMPEEGPEERRPEAQRGTEGRHEVETRHDRVIIV